MSRPFAVMGQPLLAMSVTTSDSSTCKSCNSEYQDYYAPGYCSETCYHEHTGNKLLNLIRHDHCHCVQCGATVKEVEEPTDEALRQIDGFHSKTSVVGFQYRTPQADTGEKVVQTVGRQDRKITGIICGECGSTNLNEEFPELRSRHLFEHTQGILDTLSEKQDEHNKTIREDVVYSRLLEGDSLSEALGRAVE